MKNKYISKDYQLLTYRLYVINTWKEQKSEFVNKDIGYRMLFLVISIFVLHLKLVIKTFYQYTEC